MFRRELRNVGHLEGKEIVIEARFANNKLDRLSVLADELVRLKVDLLVVPSTPGALAAKNATRTTPIIFLPPVIRHGWTGWQLATSLRKYYWIHHRWIRVGWKTIGATKRIVMNLSRIAVLWDSRDATTAQQWKESQFTSTRNWGCSFIRWKWAKPTNTNSSKDISFPLSLSAFVP
jgi:ABC-type uncharacterized transport system substrate-binding protein